MASETIKCPHCECKVLLSEVEKEDGLCPECGQLVMASNLFDDYEDEEDFDEEDFDDDSFDDEEEDFDDDFEDEFDETDEDPFFDMEEDEFKPKRGKKSRKFEDE